MSSHIFKKLIGLGLAVTIGLAIKELNINMPSISQQAGISSSSPSSVNSGLSSTSSSELANLDYVSGNSAVINVNNGKSTLDPKSWVTNKVTYANLDSLNRTSSPNTAFLEKRNATNDDLRSRQTVDPTAWHSNGVLSKTQIYNRGHEIAYSISKGIAQSGQYDPSAKAGDQNNPKNLFTQSAFSNQELQTVYESKVREALYQNKKVIYQVQPIFRGNELMARGVQLQAISTDGYLNFNVYIYNVQPGLKFNYENGKNVKNSDMKVPKLASSPSFNN